jgi:hypothetical protein
MKRFYLIAVLVHFNSVAIGQNFNIDQVQKNLMHYNWAATIFNGTGSFKNGTGLYHFTVDLDRRGRYSLSFYVRAQGEGEWNIEEINAGEFVLELKFEEARYSPFRSCRPIRFKINNPFSLKEMELVLLPDGADQENGMSMTKIM